MPTCAPLAAPRRLAKTEPRSLAPAIAWDGSAAVVAWIEDRGGSQNVAAVRFAADAEPPEPVDLGGRAAIPPVAVAASGGKTLVLWADDSDRASELYGRWIGAEGPAGAARRLSDAARRDTDRGERVGLDLLTGGAREPTALGRASDVVAGWSMPEPPRSQIFLSRWAGDGAPSEPVVSSVGPLDAWSAAIADAGDRVSLAYCVGVPGRYEILQTTLVEGAGARGPTKIADTPWGPCTPAIAKAGDGHVIAWVGGDDREAKVWTTFADPSGTPTPPRELGPIAPRVPGAQVDRLVVATATPHGVVVAWAAPKEGGGAEIRATLLGPGGEVLAGPTAVTSGTNQPSDPSIVAAGDEVLLVFHDFAPGETEDVQFARFSCR